MVAHNAVPRNMENIRSRVHVNPETGCWEWVGSRTKNRGKRPILGGEDVRSIVYQIEIGGCLKDEDMVPTVTCGNSACVNPDHLSAESAEVVRKRNLRKAIDIRVNKQLTGERKFCAHGHEWTPANIYIDKRGAKTCKECARARDRQRAAAKKAAQ